jgi:hypothetical protein
MTPDIPGNLNEKTRIPAEQVLPTSPPEPEKAQEVSSGQSKTYSI